MFELSNPRLQAERFWKCRLEVNLMFFAIPAKAGIRVLGFPPRRSLDARLRGHDGTSLRLMSIFSTIEGAWDFNHSRK